MIDFEIIWRKIHASLTKTEEEALDHWLREREEHRRFFKDAKRFYAQGSAFDKTPANTQEAWQKIMKITTKKHNKNRKIIAYVSAIAASILLLMVAGIYFWRPLERETQVVIESVQPIEPGTGKAVLIMDDGTTHDLSAGQNLALNTGGVRISSQGTSIEYAQDENAPPEIKYNTLKIPRGGEFFLTLADGTRVWLNSETTLRYPVHFTGEERKVDLLGEAFFEVKKDEKSPFRVTSGEQVVEVLGTAFNISSYADDSLTLTTLVEGKVNVFLGDNPAIKQTLLPNHQSYLVKDEGAIAQRKVDPQEYIAWKEGRFYFKDQSLGNMMKTLSRWYDVEVVFENEQARDILFTGNVKRYESFEKILELIEKTHEVTFTIEGRSISIE